MYEFLEQTIMITMHTLTQYHQKLVKILIDTKCKATIDFLTEPFHIFNFGLQVLSRESTEKFSYERAEKFST